MSGNLQKYFRKNIKNRIYKIETAACKSQTAVFSLLYKTAEQTRGYYVEDKQNWQRSLEAAAQLGLELHGMFSFGGE